MRVKRSHRLRPPLEEAILVNSQEQHDINKAILEWDVMDEYNKKKSKCVCTQNPITHCSIIKNRITGKILDPIGNECIRHFGNLTDQLDTLLKKDNKMVGKYAGLTFEDVVKLHPEYKPNEYECEQYKTCIQYRKYRDFVLQDYDDAISTIRRFIMPIIQKKKEEKQPKCVSCGTRFSGEQWQYLCRGCFRRVGTWVKDQASNRWVVKISIYSQHHSERMRGEHVWVDVVSKSGNKKRVRLEGIVRIDKGYSLWTCG